MIKLGKRYRDKVSGFAGIATERNKRWLQTTQVQLTAEVLDSGKPIEAWFVEGRLEPFDREEAIGYMLRGASAANVET